MSQEIFLELAVLYKKRKYKDIVVLLEKLFESDFEQAVYLLFKGNSKINKLISDRKFLEKFWNSLIPSKFGCKIVINTIYASDFFKEYFKQKMIYHEFINDCFANCEDEVLRYFRYYAAFLSDYHWKIFFDRYSKHENSYIVKLFKEFETLRTLSGKSKEAIQGYDSFIRNSTVDEIISGFSIYSEKIYFSCESEVFFQRRRPILLSLLEDALNMKKRMSKEKKIDFPTEKKLNEASLNLLKFLELGRYPRIFKLFDDLDEIAQLDFLIEMYCWQNWKIDFIEGVPFIKPPESWSREEWNNVDRKYAYYFNYYYGHNIEDVEFAERFSEDAVNDVSKRGMMNFVFSSTYLLNELGITDKIHLKKYTVDASACLYLAGVVAGCYESQFQHVMAKFKSEGLSYLDAIRMIFFKYNVAPRLPAEFRTLKQVSENAEKSGLPDIDTVKATYHLMSANLEDTLISLDNKAIIRSSSGYVLLMRYFHPDTISVFYNSILREEVNSNNSYSEFQEQKLSELLRLRGWAAESSVDLCSSRGQRCEIDAVAYNDGILFVVEAKQTYFRRSHRSIMGHLSVLQKAGRQLEKTLMIIEDQYDEISRLLKIELPFKQLRIVPLIVSSSFEFDGHLFSGFRKVSLFELQLLLEGSAIRMKHSTLIKEFMSDSVEKWLSDRVASGYSTEEERELFKQQTAHIFESESLDKIDEHVRLPQISCESSISDVANAIESGTIWQYLLDGEEPEKSKIAPLVINGEIVALYAC